MLYRITAEARARGSLTASKTFSTDVQGVAVDRGGMVYVTEYGAGGTPRVVKLSPAGELVAIWQ